MKVKRGLATLPLLLAIFINSCTPDFIQKDISGQTVQLMAPANGLQTSVETQTFWWNTVDGADKYELQIVLGTFSYVQKLILDTNVVNNKFYYSLVPGSYQWRVRAINGGSKTQYTTFSVTIDTTSNMAGQTVLLVSPSNNFYSNHLSNTFSWDSIAGAANYRVQILSQPSNNVIVDTTTKWASLKRSLAQGTYTWQVRAQNNSSNSPYSSNTLTIDTTHPNVPVLLTPADSSTTPTTHFTLTWSRGVEPGIAPVKDSVFIYSNQALTVLLKDTLTSATSFADTLAPGTYYWRVSSANAAGSRSNYSKVFRLTTP